MHIILANHITCVHLLGLMMLTDWGSTVRNLCGRNWTIDSKLVVWFLHCRVYCSALEKSNNRPHLWLPNSLTQNLMRLTSTPCHVGIWLDRLAHSTPYEVVLTELEICFPNDSRDSIDRVASPQSAIAHLTITRQRPGLGRTKRCLPVHSSVWNGRITASTQQLPCLSGMNFFYKER